MSTDRDTTRIVRSWLEEGVTALPDRVLDAVLDQVPATSQRRSWWPARRFRDMNVSVRLALATAAVVVVAFAGYQFLVPSQQVGGPPTSPPSDAPSATASPPASPVPTLPAGGNPVFPGTYTPAFQPTLTLTADKVVDLDCAPGFQCRGSVDANMPSWLDMEFGTTHGAELMVIALGQVLDPGTNSLIAPPVKPADVAALLATSPKLSVLAAPKAVKVGGLDASQLDVRAQAGFSLGVRPDVAGDFGLATKHDTRLIVVVVDGHTVVITEQIGPGNTVGDFQAAINSLELMLNSISWG
jgi:hypothetical protein